MILTKDELKAYLPVSNNADLNVTDVHQTRAWQKYFPRFTGRAVMAIAEGIGAPEALLLKIKPALAFFTLVESIPFLDLVLTGSGFGIVQNTNLVPASGDRVKALAQAALEAGNNAMDDLLFYLETTSSYASTWNRSCLARNCLVRNMADFQAVANINESRVRFISYIPMLETYQRQRIVPVVGARQVDDLMLRRVDTKVLPLLKKALVEFVLAKEDSTYYELAQSDLMLAQAALVADKVKYVLYHTDMYEAPHENNEDAYPVFGL